MTTTWRLIYVPAIGESFQVGSWTGPAEDAEETIRKALPQFDLTFVDGQVRISRKG